jgi:hypothetical protein
MQERMVESLLVVSQRSLSRVSFERSSLMLETPSRRGNATLTGPSLDSVARCPTPFRDILRGSSRGIRARANNQANKRPLVRLSIVATLAPRSCSSCATSSLQ